MDHDRKQVTIASSEHFLGFTSVPPLFHLIPARVSLQREFTTEP